MRLWSAWLMKKPACAGFDRTKSTRVFWTGLLDGANGCRQPALMAGCLVFVQQTTRTKAIKQGFGNHQGRLSTCFIAGFNGFDDFFYCRTDHGTLTVIVQPRFFRGACTFFRGLDICHRGKLRNRDTEGRTLSWDAPVTSIKIRFAPIISAREPLFALRIRRNSDL